MKDTAEKDLAEVNEMKALTLETPLRPIVRKRNLVNHPVDERKAVAVAYAAPKARPLASPRANMAAGILVCLAWSRNIVRKIFT